MSYSRKIKSSDCDYYWDLFLQFYPILNGQFLAEAPYHGIRKLEKLEQYGALYCLDKNKPLPWEEQGIIKYFDEKETHTNGLITGLVRDRQRHHAEKVLLSHFMKDSNSTELDPSKLPNVPTMLFYTTNSPCGGCIPRVAEFVNSCNTCSIFVIFFKCHYRGNRSLVNDLICCIPHKKVKVQAKVASEEDFTMVIIMKYKYDKKSMKKKGKND